MIQSPNVPYFSSPINSPDSFERNSSQGSIFKVNKFVMRNSYEESPEAMRTGHMTPTKKEHLPFAAEPSELLKPSKNEFTPARPRGFSPDRMIEMIH